MAKFTCIFLLSILHFITGYAQKPTFSKTYFLAGYHGNMITNPGISGGLEWAISEKTNTKTKIKRTGRVVKYKTNRFEFCPTLGFYTDPGSQNSAFLNLTTQYKRIDNKGRNFTFGVGIGHLTNFLQDIYSYSNGIVTQTNSQQIGYFAPSIIVGVGKFSKNNDYKTGWYSSVRTQFLLNYTTTVLPLPALEIGKRF